MNNEKFDVIIIGAGIGGLNAGIYLQSKNQHLRTLIIEKNNYPGGYVSGFKNNGFYFDSGAESILGYEKSFANLELNKLDFQYPFHKVDPIEAYYHDDKIIRMFSDLDKFLAEIHRYYPDQVEGVRALIVTSHKIKDEITKSKLDNEKLSFGKLVRIIFRYPYLRKYGRMNFKQFLEKFISNENIYEYFNLFCLWFGLKFEELRAPIAAHILSSSFSEGLFYPQGGFDTFARKLADHFVSKGGAIKYQTVAKKIIVQNKIVEGVELDDGTIIKSKIVISNGDLHKTILNYVGKEHFNKRYLKYIQNLKPSVSGILLYLGVEDLDLSNYPPHFIIGKNINIIPNLRNETFDLEGLGVRIPSNADPGTRDKKRNSLVILGFAPYKWNDFWRVGQDGKRTSEYKLLKKDLTEKIIAVVEKVIPEISKYIVHKRLATPLTFEKFNLSTNGSWYGPESNQKLPRFKSPIKNLYFAGSNVGGSGVSSAMTSGIKTGEFVLKKLTKKAIKES
ncbi:MAG: NAD(P)/FAD-dependent oxidoreductase [Candidatus Heimdallarchaeota archaeon]|nr:NAD(P)/FAD-dependent oxidoreductase [Candidatus Heimdallarchaeota archaeon]